MSRFWPSHLDNVKPLDMSKIVYDVRAVTKQYPGQERPANLDISLQIHQGEIFGRAT